MKNLSFIEITALVRELKDLAESRVDRIFNPSENRLLIYLYHPALKKIALKVDLPTHICITEYKEENPEMPSHFCMFLRKYLTNAKITKIEQEPYERIIKIYFKKAEEKYVLVCELFSKGNLILCDEQMRILIPLKAQVWKDRTIKVKMEYLPPPKQADLVNIEAAQFSARLKNSGSEQIVKAIALMGIGGTFAEELCTLSNIPKEKNPFEVTEPEYKHLFKNFQEIIENAKEGEIRPNLVYDEEKLIDAVPFYLQIYKPFKKQDFNSYNAALDEFFLKTGAEKVTISAELRIAEAVARQEKILEQHQGYLEETEDEAKMLKEKADLVYANFSQLDSMRHKIFELKKNSTWQQIIPELKKESFVKEIIPEQGKVVVELDGKLVDFDITQEVTAFANDLYEEAKKLNAKRDGINKIIEDTKAKIEQIKQQKLPEIKTRLITPIKKEKQWYEKFIWFYTSGNRLVIGGRDAGQNEMLVNKYLDPSDVVFHADVHGSPFVVMKDGEKSSEEEKTEAAIFTLCNSKAWQAKRVQEVYWVKPEQVSKHAPAGEYIARGGFMIYGKKSYMRGLELRYAIGIQPEPFRVISGPVENVRHKARYYAVILPGENNKDELAKKIKKFLASVVRESDKELLEKIDIEDLKEHCLQDSKIFGVSD